MHMIFCNTHLSHSNVKYVDGEDFISLRWQQRTTAEGRCDIDINGLVTIVKNNRK